MRNLLCDVLNLPLACVDITRTSDGHYLGRAAGDCGFNMFFGRPAPSHAGPGRDRSRAVWRALTWRERRAVVRRARAIGCAPFAAATRTALPAALIRSRTGLRERPCRAGRGDSSTWVVSGDSLMGWRTSTMATATYRIGNDEHGAGVFVEIEIESRSDTKGPRLSMSGTCAHGGGQCVDVVRAVCDFAPGWDAAKRDRLVDVWERWHLNDMHAGCEHQRAAWDLDEQITTESYRVEWDVQRALERQHEKVFEPREFLPACDLLFRLQDAGVKPFAWALVSGARQLAALADGFEIIGEHDRDARADYDKRVLRQAQDERDLRMHVRRVKPYISKRTTTTAACWVRPEDHPAGLLGKPCDVCGYKYGSAWRHEELPADVLAFVESLAADAAAVGVSTTESAYDTIARDFLTRHGFTFEAVHAKVKASRWDADSTALHWRCTIRRQADGATYKSDFWNSIDATAKGRAVSAHDFLTCLASDSTLGDADEIADELGMKPSQAIAAARAAEQIREYFREDELEALRRIS